MSVPLPYLRDKNKQKMRSRQQSQRAKEGRGVLGGAEVPLLCVLTDADGGAAAAHVLRDALPVAVVEVQRLEEACVLLGAPRPEARVDAPRGVAHVRLHRG